MKAVFLGTGTSCGVPVIGCDCSVCVSTDPRNKRRRSSLYLTDGVTHLIVDTTPDFREQALTFRVPRVDAVFYTHAHADHVFGLDDIRRFNTIQRQSIPAYGSEETVADLKRIFNYVNSREVPGVYRPQVEFVSIDGPVEVGAFRVEPLPVTHGRMATFGYQVVHGARRLGYIPDCASMSDDVVRRLAGADVMILDALRHLPHSTHLTVEESLTYLRRIGAGRSYLTHMTHDIDHAVLSAALPERIHVSWDGLQIDW